MLNRSARAVSFGTAAEEYDRFRMGPSEQVLDWLLPPDCAAVLDLGAGTGLLTRQLAERVDDVLAVEPDARMREVLAAGCPRATVLEGTAENIPLPGARVGAVTVSAAWHWMDPVRALPEIARVLQPGGTLAILWTRRDRRVPWVDALDSFVRDLVGAGDEVERQIRRMGTERWLPDGVPFTEPESRVLTWTAPLTVDALVGMFATYSGFIAQPEERKRELAGLIDAQVHRTADIADGTVRMPMACHTWRLRLTEAAPR
ncbi:class I SAM-dependent methyltransferase [Streptomyces sp. SL13]|jgi:SAM-dependent methyltransferase|uniref:Class I SAM-dependent methyltransferase n=1 Tax=Streptantibioticus silvisoli TaxID=2705255 RepID=A0AA90H3F3_9ACTN|nr:class I SAM-dependent methyltransferase [Streptantibioticus silvisoli]MDI5963702.1 class I SAM-dependent methyltransferase [Streptantibioticus silvisoli]MDI5969542.1 class I SAM-dependent methyltransferase [Streptantibioticus silvisoli]